MEWATHRSSQLQDFPHRLYQQARLPHHSENDQQSHLHVHPSAITFGMKMPSVSGGANAGIDAHHLALGSPQPRPAPAAGTGAGAAARENVLDFSNSYYGDDKSAEIVEYARNAPFPTVLDLRGNRFEALGAKVLADLLRAQHNIVSISLEWNNVGLLDQGVESLALALEIDTRLVALDMRNNNVGPDGAKALAKALARNRTLKQLDLRWNDIGNAGVLAFREALQGNYTLLKLELMGNNSSLKHVEEIEKLLSRNRVFQEQQPPPPLLPSPVKIPHEAPREEFKVEETKHTDDQLLLQVLAEKENCESELILARKEAQKLNEKIEESEMHIQMLRKDAEALKEERNRFQQRELDAKRDTHELKMQLDELENKRKMEFEEYRSSRTALERDLSAMREKMSHLESLQSKSMEQKNKQIAQLEDQKYSQDSEIHKLNLSIRALEGEVAKCQKQVFDAQKDFEKKEDKLISSHQSCMKAQQRQYELEVHSLTSQLTHITLQFDEAQHNASAFKEKTENLQASVLQSKISHEREITELKKQWELDLQERIQRSVGSVEAQVEEVKKGRLHLEREAEKHMETIMRLRQESISLQQISDEKQRGLHEELEKQYKEIQEKQDLWAAVTKEKARCEEKIEAHARRLEEQDTRLVRMKNMYEERIHEMAKNAQVHSQEMKDALKQKAETIAALESQVLRLEREISKQTREHEKRIDRFAESVSAFVQEQITKEREQRNDKHEAVESGCKANEAEG